MDRNHSATNSSARAASTAVPAVPAKRRRWYQFSLQTLAISVVAISVALGLFGVRLQRARRQAAGVNVLRRYGGDVLYDFEIERDGDGYLIHHSSPSSVPSWLLHSLGQDFFHGVAIAEVRFESGGKTPAELDQISSACGDLHDVEVLTFFGFDVPNFERMRGLTKVRDLTITIPPLKTRDFKVIAEMKNLEVLHCSGQRINGEAASHLRRLSKLRQFTAHSGSIVDDDALEQLSRCRALRQLTICHTDITDAGVRHLATLPQLEWLVLDGTHFTDAGLASIARIETLRFISLAGTKITGKGVHWPKGLTDAWLSETLLTDDGLQELSKCRSLTRLELGDTQVSSAGIRHVASLPRLEWLELQGTSVSDDGLACLAELSTLKHLSLDRTNVTDRGLAHLASLPRLESLSLFETKVTGEGFEWPMTLTWVHLSGSQLSDNGLMRLAKCPKLNDLLLESTPVTSAGIAKFTKARAAVNLTGY